MKNLIILLLFLNVKASGQSQIKDLIYGEWRLKAFKSSPIFNELKSNNNNHLIATNDSIINIIVKKDYLTIIKKRIYPKDTLTFEYKIDTVETSYGSIKNKINLLLSKDQLKSFGRKYRKSFKNISFEIEKLNYNQLVITNYQFERNIYFPLFTGVISTYYFVKNSGDNFSSRLCQPKGWFAQFDNNNILETDTITFQKDSLEANGLRHYHFIFSENYFEGNKLKINDVTPQWGVSSYTYIRDKNWFIKENEIVIIWGDKKTSYNYQFIDKKLVLIKNGS